MKTNYKIFVLPVVVFLFALGSIFIEKPIEPNKTSLSKTIPFPLKQVPKTEWTKPGWSTDSVKSFSTYIISLPIIRIERPKAFSIICNEVIVFYSSGSKQKQNDRAPPLFS
jgi:hypothetical protein